MNAQQVKGLLAKYHIAALKSLGQNFLINEGAALQVIHIADIKGYDTILEIGPGLGVLTKHLGAKAKKLIAVEIDKGFVSILKEELGSFPNVEIVNADILKFSLPRGIDTVVGNLPYHLAGAILEKLLSVRALRPHRIVLTVQKEFAMRLTAKPGQSNRIGLFTRYHGTPRIVQEFPPHYFWPQPKVRSALVCVELKPAKELALSETQEPILWQLIKTAFNQPRKKLRNSISLDMSRFDERRPQELSLDDWLAVVNHS